MRHRGLLASAVALSLLIASCSAGANDDPAPGSAPDSSDNGAELAGSAPRRPNIVVFLTDDQTVEQLRVMTQTDALLAAGGVTFTQSFVNVAVCCPSRATLLTGQHASHHGVLTNSGLNGGFAAFEDQEHTLATGLEGEGYHTLFVGRYLNGYGLRPELRYVPPGWTDFQALVAPTDTLYFESTFFDNGELVSSDEDDYATDLITDRALRALDEPLRSDQPLFAIVSYPAPHAQGGLPIDEYDRNTFFTDIEERYPEPFLTPPVPAERHADTLGSERAPRGPAFNEEDTLDKPAFLQRFRLDDTLESDIDAYYRAGLESLLAVDESIAAVMGRFEEAGLQDDTYFIFTSDNGLLHGQHRLYGVKYLPYEEAIRVPLIARGPGISAGRSTSAVVSNVDVAATVFELAGVEPNRTGDGRSLVGLLTGTEEPWGRAVLLEGFELRSGSPPFRGVHTGDSVYVEWATGALELYDLAADPYQLLNLADDPAAADLLARNEGLLRELEQCAGEACGSIGSELNPPPHPAR